MGAGMGVCGGVLMHHRLEDQRREILELLAAKDFFTLKAVLSEMEPADLADLLEDVFPPRRVLLFRLLAKDQAIEVFEFMEGMEREELLNHVTDAEVAEIINEMSDDDRTELFDELPAKTVKKLLRHLNPQERTLANKLLNYPDDSAGRIMTPEYIDLKVSMTVEEALKRIRQEARAKETIYTCFVVDAQRHLIGVVELEDLILAEQSTEVGALMNDDPISVTTLVDQEHLAQILSRYDLQAVPVVDREKRLVGIVTFDDILDVVEEEATEDFQRMAGIQPTEDSYLDTGIFSLARKRFMWLVICIVTEAMTSTVLKNYSIAMENVVALTFFIPLLIGTGGNAGTQSATLFIRSMTLGHVQLKDMGIIFGRETLTGILLGVALAVLGVGRALMLGTGMGVAITVALALVAVVLIGNLSGVVLPIIAKAIKVDPAIMSGPFITTVVDVLGLIVYFEIARAVLGIG